MPLISAYQFCNSDKSVNNFVIKIGGHWKKFEKPCAIIAVLGEEYHVTLTGLSYLLVFSLNIWLYVNGWVHNLACDPAACYIVVFYLICTLGFIVWIAFI